MARMKIEPSGYVYTIWYYREPHKHRQLWVEVTFTLEDHGKPSNMSFRDDHAIAGDMSEQDLYTRAISDIRAIDH
jgi:hypothetical protein